MAASGQSPGWNRSPFSSSTTSSEVLFLHPFCSDQQGAVEIGIGAWRDIRLFQFADATSIEVDLAFEPFFFDFDGRVDQCLGQW